MSAIGIALILTLFGALLQYEAKAWFPRAISAVIDLAARRLPTRQRARFREEWSAHVEEVPGAVAKLWHAAGFVIGAGKMFPRWRRGLAYRRAAAREVVAARITGRTLDLLIVIPTLFVLAPMLFFVMLASAIEGPALYREARIGRRGRPFYAYRIRTASVGGSGSSRMTRLGRFLKLRNLDELPVLVSVLFGDMSLVGPRHVGDALPEVRPGLFNISDLDAFIGMSVHKRVSATLRAYYRMLRWVLTAYW